MERINKSVQLMKLKNYLKYSEETFAIEVLRKFQDHSAIPCQNVTSDKEISHHFASLEPNQGLEALSLKNFQIGYSQKQQPEDSSSEGELSSEKESIVDESWRFNVSKRDKGNNFKGFSAKLKKTESDLALKKGNSCLTKDLEGEFRKHRGDAQNSTSKTKLINSKGSQVPLSFQERTTANKRAETMIYYDNVKVEASHSGSEFCPLCFQSFSDRNELGYHFQFNCSVVETGRFLEPLDLSLFQIVHNGIKCTDCKLKISESWAEEHRRKAHPEKSVRHIFCSICLVRMVFTRFEVSRHCGTKDHQELLKIRIDQRRQNLVQILREDGYCLLCKIFLPLHKIVKHVASSSHTQIHSEVVFWCYFCEMGIQSCNVVKHCKGISHKHNSCFTAYCLFCHQVWTLPKFIEHVIQCVTENS